MRKKIISCVLVAVMLAGLGGCGSVEENTASFDTSDDVLVNETDSTNDQKLNESGNTSSDVDESVLIEEMEEDNKNLPEMTSLASIEGLEDTPEICTVDLMIQNNDIITEYIVGMGGESDDAILYMKTYTIDENKLITYTGEWTQTTISAQTITDYIKENVKEIPNYNSYYINQDINEITINSSNLITGIYRDYYYGFFGTLNREDIFYRNRETPTIEDYYLNKDFKYFYGIFATNEGTALHVVSVYEGIVYIDEDAPNSIISLANLLESLSQN